MTAIKSKRLIIQLMLSAFVLICVCQPIFANRKTTPRRIRNVIIKLSIDKLLENEKLEISLERWSGSKRWGGSVGGVSGGMASGCSHCAPKPYQRYSYSISADRQKEGGAIVRFKLEATVADGQGVFLERDFYVPRQGMVEKDFGCDIKLTAYIR